MSPHSTACSPHARGWSYEESERDAEALVLPARAGMVLNGAITLTP